MLNIINNVLSILDSHISDPVIELEYDYKNPYLLLIAVLLSAQSTDKQVNTATEILFKVIQTPEQMIKMGYDGLIPYIKSIGLYKTKAKNIIALSAKLINTYNSSIPSTRDELMSLPGIGRKSADVILNVVFNQPTVPVDTHVFRVCNRIGICNISNRDKMSDFLEQSIPQHVCHDLTIKAHHLFVLHGRYTCKAIKPLCNTCPLRDICQFYKTQQYNTLDLTT